MFKDLSLQIHLCPSILLIFHQVFVYILRVVLAVLMVFVLILCHSLPLPFSVPFILFLSSALPSLPNFLADMLVLDLHLSVRRNESGAQSDVSHHERGNTLLS